MGSLEGHVLLLTSVFHVALYWLHGGRVSSDITDLVYSDACLDRDDNA